MGHNKNKNKRVMKLTDDHEYYRKKVEELEHEREKHRDFSHKALLVKLKKIKLSIKDELNRLIG